MIFNVNVTSASKVARELLSIGQFIADDEILSESAKNITQHNCKFVICRYVSVEGGVRYFKEKEIT
jgi:hypothetical protein